MLFSSPSKLKSRSMSGSSTTSPDAPGPAGPSTQASAAPAQASVPASTSTTSHKSSKIHLTIPDVANLFIKMRRAGNNARASSAAPKPNFVESISGDRPQSHNELSGQGVTSIRKLPMAMEDTYVCIGGVNAKMLLRATRTSLMEQAEQAGANVLVDEQWKCTIRGPKNGRTNGAFKVTIQYSASAARSVVSDPHKPVALENAKGIPGLMTILRRNE
ncbi:hypothetical protein HGRIS_011767 [Hohenbuehelia grisea]|uniref:Uncharacterized protein n=1 Tax=Hohenbuehelia grisea TaxID=104357 RepID=A0ABR3JXU7_9AGAR